jgi:hypothetical protein
MHRMTTWLWIGLAILALLAYAAGVGFSILILFLLGWLAVTMIRLRLRADQTDDAAGLGTEPSPTATGSAIKPDAITEAAVAYSSTVTLCDLWIRSHEAINHAYLPSSIESYANLRAAILDELTRRDPEGVERWLNDQPVAHNPHLYLRESKR